MEMEELREKKEREAAEKEKSSEETTSEESADKPDSSENSLVTSTEDLTPQVQQSHPIVSEQHSEPTQYSASPSTEAATTKMPPVPRIHVESQRLEVIEIKTDGHSGHLSPLESY